MIMENVHCTICGQKLTDASGNWFIHARDCGISHRPDVKFRCCSWCVEGVREAIETLSEERTEERKKWQ